MIKRFFSFRHRNGQSLPNLDGATVTRKAVARRIGRAPTGP
jgi:hypothetical protein